MNTQTQQQLGEIDPTVFQAIVMRTASPITAGAAAQTLTQRIPPGMVFEWEDVRFVAIVSTTNGTAVVGTALPGPADALQVTTTIPGLHLIEAEILVQSTSQQGGISVPVTLIGGVGNASAGQSTRGRVNGGQDLSVKINNKTNLHGTPVSVDVIVYFVGRWRAA